MFKATASRLVLIGSPVAVEGTGRRGKSTAASASLQVFRVVEPQKQLSLPARRCCTVAKAVPVQRNFLKTEEDLRQQEKQSQQGKWAVSVTKCGIAKEFNGSQVLQQLQMERAVYGDDACFVANHGHTYVAGIADGVGGWRRHGIDPSQFSSQLMANCAEIVRSGDFDHSRPDLIISRAYNKLKKAPRPIGSSTACVLVVSKRRLYSANLGDSGYLICRGGKVIFRSPEQTHYFNAPYQLTLLPETMRNEKATFLLDRPECSELREHELQSGDLVLMATDGLWDNCHIGMIAELLDGEWTGSKRATSSTNDETDGGNIHNDKNPVNDGEAGTARKEKVTQASLQARCNSLALIARHLAADEKYVSPFTQRAKAHGIRALGGKPDDVTIVLFHVS